jgi:hypothetical protein
MKSMIIVGQATQHQIQGLSDDNGFLPLRFDWLEIETAPLEVTECNCSICRRYGVLWAYYSPTQVNVGCRGKPATPTCGDDRSMMFLRCPNCGCVSHWSAVYLARDRMGIDARLMAPEVLTGARVRHLDGAVTEQYLD